MTRLVSVPPAALALCATALIGLAGTACSSNSAGEADCAWVLSYRSHTYQRPSPMTIGVRKSVHHQSPTLGKGTLKGCTESHGRTEDTTISVYRIKGVPTSQAVIDGRDTIGLTDPKHIPASVRKLLTFPRSPAPS